METLGYFLHYLIKLKQEKSISITHGLKIPFRATSMRPLENKAPQATPILARIIIVLKEIALEPTAEFRKLTASLLTPTIKSPMAKIAKTATSIT